MTETVVSRDGTVIGYDRYGTGPAVILVGGAFQYRAIDQPTARLAHLLAARHTVLHYDRRGRGDSGDTAPYAPQREVEDIAALLDAVGGSAAVFGMSSGAVLAIDAAADGLPITRLALYEPPLRVAGTGVPDGYLDRLRARIAAGDRAGAVRTFVTEAVGLPGETADGMLATPEAALFTAVAPTLAYDCELTEELSRGTPIPSRRRDRWATVEAPVLIMDGTASAPFMASAADAVAAVLANARRRTFDGQSHAVDPDVLAPVLLEFFDR